ncbi:chromosome-associated kinesin KIF4A-like [Penaeus monodon]|uniref:chromosome-associated kinesin KIF4A-like n=1 Tax=Penaeus monodon TaxID=6687 RepID=UPI0018A76604|nr:chromosome-associated kinesin KIF4A-like [Penaeus monodon]
MVSFKTHNSRTGEPLGAMKLKGERELTKGLSVHFVDSRGQELLSATTARAAESPGASALPDDEGLERDGRGKAQENAKGRGRRRGTESSSAYPARSPTKGKRSQSQPEVPGAWEQPDTPAGEPVAEAQEKLFVRRRSVESLEGEKDRNSAESSRREGFGSASSLEQSMTRSLGSRGSLCDEAVDECDNINVVVRCRPVSEKEIKRGDENNLIFPGEGQVWVNMDGLNGQGSQKPKVFTYNVVFEPEATQEDIFDHSGIKRLLDMAIEGFSCTTFCYGQTGSGKTHTLTGPPHLYYTSRKSLPTITGRELKKQQPRSDFFRFEKGPHLFSEEHGLIFRSFVYLFSQLQSREDQEFTLTASYLEIYNEKVIDLLNIGTNQKPLQVRWSKKKRGFFVENLFEIECAELDDLLAVLEEGLRNRAIASHNMNEYSSRSHTILSVNITSEKKADDGVYITRNGKINFVDLAGSEMTKKTNSEGKTLEEANNINKSLMVLGTCIAALSDSRKRDGHIPYRDSNLTKLLADSLAGSGVTLMIACASPARSNVSETINTFRYASRAKRIRTKPLIIMDPKEKVILSLQREVSLLREENAHLKMLLDLADVQESNQGEALPKLDRAKILSGNDSATITEEDGSRMDIYSCIHKHQLLAVLILTVNPQTSSSIVNLKFSPHTPTSRIPSVHPTEHSHHAEGSYDAMATLVRDQDLVCKENERLLKKLQELSSGTSSDSKDEKDMTPRPPTQRVTTAGEVLDSAGRAHSLPTSPSSQVWVNPLNDTSRRRESPGTSRSTPGTSRSTPGSRGRSVAEGKGSPRKGNRLPDSINKELERRRIGKSMNDLSASGGGSGGRSSGGRRNSWDGEDTSGLPAVRRPPVKSKSMSPGLNTTKSGTRVKGRSQSVPRQKGRGKGSPGGPPKTSDRRPTGMRSS